MAEVTIIGCKLPGGLYLQVGAQTIRINGKSRYNMPSPTQVSPNIDVEYGDGLTTVDKAFAEAWFAEHNDYEPVRQKLVYMSPNRNDAVARAKDTEAQKVPGLDPMNPTEIKSITPAPIMGAGKGKR